MIWRTHKSELGSGYKVKKVLEDKETKIVGGATTVVHDVKTGRQCHYLYLIRLFRYSDTCSNNRP